MKQFMRNWRSRVMANPQWFICNWQEYGLSVAIYNAVFAWLHRHDDHVRVWQEGERCSGC